VSVAIAAEFDLSRVVQLAIEAAAEVSEAACGSFLSNQSAAAADLNVPLEVFTKRFMLPNALVVAATFRGDGIIRSPDNTADAHFAEPSPDDKFVDRWGDVEVRSCLAVPVVSRSGEIIDGLFFGHPEPGFFTERAERWVGSIAAIVAIAIDKARLYQEAQDEIEERKRTEGALRESEQTLESKVAERTEQLLTANQRLLAEAADRERAEAALRHVQKLEGIGHLTGGVAHDFNNLLTVIVGNLEALQRHLQDASPDPARLLRSTTNALCGAKRAETLTQRLLAFARQQSLDPKPVDVGRLVTGMSDLLHRTIGEQISVKTVLSGGLWRVHADPNQLEVAILNLAVNARDAMPSGGRLTIETGNVFLDQAYARTQVEFAPGQYVELAITDTGLGMSQAVISQAVEPFFTTKDVGHGTGLGLSQVYGFVKQSGGHVKIYSELGQGTTVKIYLPRFHSEDVPVAPEPVPTIPHSARTETILMVEDDDDVRNYTRESLSELGYRVLEAPSGRAALETIRQNPDIDLLFTDVGLPGGINGRQLADEARQLKSDLKVLFMTGYARNAIVHGGRLDPGIELILKPFTYPALAGKLRDLLDAGREAVRILVVEDEMLVQMLAVEILEEAGFKVDIAGSATEAMNKLRCIQGRVAAAIIDVGLPDRKGDVLVNEIRTIYPSLPIVVASGYAAADLGDRFKTHRPNAFLHKPYTAEQLREALRRVGIVSK
jgi:signal transduction histidine kinase/DNA-binding response OmpR family regulator